jgi:drug/metabolite transporter (DMT)-like permease
MMIAAVVIWGVNFTAVKLALREMLPLAFNGLRFSLATVVMGGILWQRARSAGVTAVRIRRSDWLPVIFLGVGGHAVYQLLFINGMARTNPANSSLLMATSPIWVVVIGYLLGVERINRLMWLGVLFSFVGIVVLISGGEGGLSLSSQTLLGDLLIVACALGWAVYTTASKPLLARYSSLTLTTWTMLAGTIPLLTISLPDMLRQDWGRISLTAWGAAAFSALLAVVVGYLVWYYSVQRVGNARTAIYSNLIPVFAIIFAWLTLGSTLSLGQWLGAGIVLAGVMLTRRGGRRREPKT